MTSENTNLEETNINSEVKYKEANISHNQECKPKYTKEKWRKIMETTQCNYANMVKRLTRKSKISNFTLIYYSIFLIVISLTSKYFPNNYNSDLAEYSSIILSVIVLAYSLVNNNANYSIRINNIENSLNELKNLKRRLNDENLNEYIEKYNKITDKTERRDDRDFFNTVRNLAKLYNISIFSKKPKRYFENIDSHGIKVVNDYLSEINIFNEICKAILEYSWYVFLFVIPIIVLILCVIFH